LRHSSKFQWVLHLEFVTAATSLTEGQPNFAQCLAISWAGILYIHFSRGSYPDRILPSAKFTLLPSLAFEYIGSITAQHSSSGRQPNFAVSYKEWNFGTFAYGVTYIWHGSHHVVLVMSYIPRKILWDGIRGHEKFGLFQQNAEVCEQTMKSKVVTSDHIVAQQANRYIVAFHIAISYDTQRPRHNGRAVGLCDACCGVCVTLTDRCTC